MGTDGYGIKGNRIYRGVAQKMLSPSQALQDAAAAAAPYLSVPIRKTPQGRSNRPEARQRLVRKSPKRLARKQLGHYPFLGGEEVSTPLRGNVTWGQTSFYCLEYFDISFLFCEGLPSSDKHTVGVFAFLTPFFKKKRKILPQGRKTGTKKAGASSLRKSPARLKESGEKRPNASKRAIKAPPRACYNPRESARQDVKTQSHRIHFTYVVANRL